MKKIINLIILFALIILYMLCIYPSNTYAFTEQNSYINTSLIYNLDVGSLSFIGISFEDISDTYNQVFGLTGVVDNNSNNVIDYTLEVYYYDSNYELIAKGVNSRTSEPGTSKFEQMNDLSVLDGHSVNEIYCYSLSIETTETEYSSVNNFESLTPSENYKYESRDYVIDKYDVNIVVNENNTLDITETITAYFNEYRHGILRTIPLKNNIKRLDGTTSNNRTQVTNVSVNNEYTLSRDINDYIIKIGSANDTVIGKQTYVIKYTYNLGKDPLKDCDELYYNIIGKDWNTVIGNITFSITMPKDFDSSKLGFSSGKYGSTDNSKIQYDVSGNIITGSYNGILGVWEAITFRCELPNDYFVGAGIPFGVMDYVMFIVPIIFLGISIVLWYKFGREDQVIETVEFYPPKEFNSLEVGFLYKGRADYKDVTSLLVYLANKGYIKIEEIEEIEEKNLLSKSKGFKITKLKEYDGNNINEKTFLDGLFKKKKSSTSLFSKISKTTDNNINEVTSDDLYNSFYKTMEKILSNINSENNKNRLIKKSGLGRTLFMILMIVITYCLITIPPVLAYSEPGVLIVALLCPIIGFSMMTYMLFWGHDDSKFNSSIGIRLFGIIWGLMFGGMPWAFSVLPSLLQDSTYLIGYIIGIVCIFGMIICLRFLPKRTSYGNEVLGKIRGFKNFLETAEKDNLEAMVMKDPTYFYNILPYTYVLSVSDKWIKKFESIALQAPSWYDSTDNFDMVSFGRFMDNTMSSAQSVMSSSPSSGGSGGSSSGGSSSSGGGFSGGGSGGGGGGSW